MSIDFLNRFTRQLTGYIPGEQPGEAGWVKLNTNEHPLPPSPAVAAELRLFAEDISVLRRYPNPVGEPLRSTLAEYFKLPPELVLVTNGSDEALSLFCRAFLDAGDTVICPRLTYSLYPVLLQTVGAQLLAVPMKVAGVNPFAIDLEGLVAACGKMVLFPNPNAPTGEFIELERLSAAIGRTPEKLWVIDEAYNDFVEAKPASAAVLLARHENLIVCRTFSKSHGLAGLRVGYVLSKNIRLMSALYALKDSYNEDMIALRLANAAFRDWNYSAMADRFVIDERKFLERELCSLGFRVIPSQANFILVHHDGVAASALYLGLKEKKILVRHFAGGLIDSYLRISIGKREENLVLLQALADIVNAGV